MVREGIGWDGATDHWHVNPEFTLVTEPAVVVVPPITGQPFTPAELQRCKDALGITPATIKRAVEKGYIWLKECYTPGEPFAGAFVGRQLAETAAGRPLQRSRGTGVDHWGSSWRVGWWRSRARTTEPADSSAVRTREHCAA